MSASSASLGCRFATAYRAVLQVGRHRRDAPVGVADGGGVGAEVRQCAGIELGLADRAGGQAGAAFALEPAMQAGKEGQRLRSQHLVLAGQDPDDLDSVFGTRLRGLLQHCRHRQLQDTVGVRTIRPRLVFDKEVLSMRII